MEPEWKKELASYFKTNSWKSLDVFVKEQYLKSTVFPEQKDIFNMFQYCPFDKVQVVILGQDPYHGTGQAHGLAFSVPDGVKAPPSLRNILKELEDELDQKPAVSGNLTSWSKQGVLLLNSVLTVEESQPASHAKKGWEEFTDFVIQDISTKKEHIIFVLWGAYAQKKSVLIDQKKHLILKSPHPSPFSAHKGFFGSNHFLQINNYLEEHNKQKIIW